VRAFRVGVERVRECLERGAGDEQRTVVESGESGVCPSTTGAYDGAEDSLCVLELRVRVAVKFLVVTQTKVRVYANVILDVDEM
jgi:hypothetical protein